ncbi:MAG: hypothetical protein ACREMA_15035, partial [Longimicrobiales bacterium]
SLRRLVAAEIERIAKPYRDQLQEWTGFGARSFPAGTRFETTSPLLQENVHLLQVLTRPEQEAIGDFMLRLAHAHPANPDQFEHSERDRLAAFAASAELAVAELAHRGGFK